MRYTRVDEAPEKLSSFEAIVQYPSFQEEIEKTKSRSGKTKLTTANYLRSIFVEIGFNHDESFNAYSSVKVASHLGRRYESDKDISDMLSEILVRDCPEVIEKRITDQLSQISRDIKIVYFVSKDLIGSRAFTRQGIEMIDFKDIKNELAEKKPKKQKHKNE